MNFMGILKTWIHKYLSLLKIDNNFLTSKNMASLFKFVLQKNMASLFNFVLQKTWLVSLTLFYVLCTLLYLLADQTVSPYKPDRGMSSALVGALVAGAFVFFMLVGFIMIWRKCRYNSQNAEGQYDTASNPNYSTVLMLNQLSKDSNSHKYLTGEWIGLKCPYCLPQ